MTSRLVRILAATCTAAAVVLGLSACSGSVSKDDVTKTVSAKLAEQKIVATDVTCPEDLKGEVGATTRCSFVTDDGQPVDVVAKVTSIDGSTAMYDLNLEARPIAKPLLESKVKTLLADQLQINADSVACTGDLQPQVNQKTSCAVADSTGQGTFDVTVTDVTGGAIKFSIQQTA